MWPLRHESTRSRATGYVAAHRQEYNEGGRGLNRRARMPGGNPLAAVTADADVTRTRFPTFSCRSFARAEQHERACSFSIGDRRIHGMHFGQERPTPRVPFPCDPKA